MTGTKIFTPQYVTHAWTHDGDDAADAFSKPATRETFTIEDERGCKIIIDIDDPRSVSYCYPKSMYSDQEWAEIGADPDAEEVTFRAADPNNLSPEQEAFVEASVRAFEGA